MEEKITKEKKSLGQIIDEHPKTVFWSRFILWLSFAGGLPFAFIVWRFQLFGKISKIHIGGWGILLAILVAFVVFTIVKYVKLAFSGRYSFIGQCLGGICKVLIPLAAFLFVLYSAKNSIDMLIQATSCVFLCELVAIPLNPLPKWAYDMQKDMKDDERKEYLDYFLDGFFKRKKEEGE